MKPLRVLLLLLVLLLASLQYKLWLGSGGQREVEALRAQVVKQEAENLGLRQRNEALKAEVEDLKSGEAAVEEMAESQHAGGASAGRGRIAELEDEVRSLREDVEALRSAFDLFRQQFD